MGFSQRLLDLIVGTPFATAPGSETPPRTVDARTHAMRALRDYVAEITFWRPAIPPVPFRVPPERFHIEWPDDIVEMVWPSFLVQSGSYVYESLGLTSYIDETTRDRFMPGTVIQYQAEYTETFQLQFAASKKPRRRAIFAGLEVAFMPTEQMSGLRLRMPGYFDQVACFTLQGGAIVDGEDSAKDRRVGQVEFLLRVPIVALVRCSDLKPVVLLEDIGPEVDVGPWVQPRE